MYSQLGRGSYYIMKLFENGESVKALLELHYKHMDLVYPAIMLFEAVISHGVVARVI